MIKGIVSGYLLPMIPVSLKKLDGDWQNRNILLDTGSEVSFMLAETTASQHGIAIRLDYNSPASIVSVQRLGNLKLLGSCRVQRLAGEGDEIPIVPLAVATTPPTPPLSEQEKEARLQ